MKNKDLNRKNNVQKNDIQKKISHEKCIFLLSFIMFALCLLSAVSFVIYTYATRVYAHCVAEAGTEILAEDFLKKSDKTAEFITEHSEINIFIPGNYDVKIKSGIFTYNCVITIQDTIAPEATLKKVYIKPGETVTPKDFITEIKDMTKVSSAFVTEPDYNIYGEQKVSILFTDLGGNKSVYETALIIRPTIEELTIEAGAAMPALTDFLLSEHKNAAFITPLQQINTNQAGDYNIEISADQTSYTTVLHIKDTTAPELVLKDIEIYTFETISMEDFIVSASDISAVDCSYVTQPDLSFIGTQQITIRAVDKNGNSIEKTANLTLKQDTEPPELILRNIDCYNFESVKTEDFIVSVSDISAVDCSYVIQPDLSLIGTQQIVIRATDKSGNFTEQTASLTLRQDTEPPVISGASDIFIYLGEKISYKKGITVSDNCDANVRLSVDSSLVNLNAEGDYPVTYSAQDISGNITVLTITVSVRQRTYSEAEVYALADRVLSEIITDSMTSYDKLTAIYNWCQRNIYYIENFEKGNWLKGAYEGLTNHKGDCYAYACVSQALLIRAGITTKMINRIPTTYEHYWNLVDIGEGWKHFDTCPRDNNPYLCYIDDANLMAYSVRNNNCHNYDRTVFIDIY